MVLSKVPATTREGFKQPSKRLADKGEGTNKTNLNVVSYVRQTSL